MHATIAAHALPLGRGRERVGGIGGLVYRSIHGINELLRRGSDHALGLLADGSETAGADPRIEAARAALNGVLGDHLERSGNPLALPMRLRRDGIALQVERAALAAALPQAGGRLLVLVHGLCMNDRQWLRAGHDHGAMLEREHGYTALRLYYNSGRHISHNGREFSALLEDLLAQWPVPVRELVLLGHSMGGLVARSAVHQGLAAGRRWCERLGALVCLGSPHHGASAERIGSHVHQAIGLSPYSAPIARLGALRSEGITDLRHGNLLEADWQGRDRFAGGDHRIPLPLPAGVRCHTVAATRSPPGAPRPAGDGLVSVASALGHHRLPQRTLAFPPEHQLLVPECNHFDLLARAEVREQLALWLA
ncbi:MAG: alpha/beta hydrolase [Xanthomonadales bacterium]|nr:alpha/beta hydrolase [Xanthomonadales bacterium]